MKKVYLSLWLLLICAIAFCGNLDDYLVILHTNDIHGRAVSNDTSIGYAKISQIKKDLIKEGADVLLFDAGDYSQGTPLVGLSKGFNSVLFMNMAGYDAKTLGNHEFDYGLDKFIENNKYADQNIICSNIFKNGKLVFEENHIFKVKDYKIGVFGLETPDVIVSCFPPYTEGYVISGERELYKIAQKEAANLSYKSDLIVCLGHLGDLPSLNSNSSIDVLKNTKGIDLFIDGHSHTRIDNADLSYNSVRVSAGCMGEALGYVLYKENKNKLTFEKAGLIDPKDEINPLTGKPIKIDKKINDKILNIQNKITEKYSKPFGRNMVTLNGAVYPGNRTEETNLGDFVCDAMLWKAKTFDNDVDCAIINGGTLRETVKEGNITLNDINTTMPFEDKLVIVTLKGKDLLELLEAASCACPIPIGGFAQVAGLEFEINTKEKYELGEKYGETSFYAPKYPGRRIKIKSINNKPFDENNDYKLAVTDFILEGGDTYFIMKKYKDTAVYEDEILSSLVVDYIKNKLNGTKGKEYENPQGRITVIK